MSWFLYYLIPWLKLWDEANNCSKLRFLTMKSTTFGAAGVLGDFGLSESPLAVTLGRVFASQRGR